MADPVLKSPTNPHFFQPLLPGFDANLNIPVTFLSKYLQGRNKLKTVKLRSDASDTVWEVKIEDGRKVTGRGWKEFVTAHDFRVGDIIVFRHEGNLVFHVTALGLSCCEIKYTSSHNFDDDDDDDQDNIEVRPVKKRAKKKPRREEDSSLDDSCFVASVSVTSLKKDEVYLPVAFARSNGLSKANGKVILLNEMGRSWKLSLHHSKSGVKTYLKHGWREFCKANRMRRGYFTFKLVQNSRTPVIRLCQTGESSIDHSSFVGSLTPSSLGHDEQYLPRGFVISNGLREGCWDEIVLKNENGGTWNLIMRHHKSRKDTVISRGWRSFCQANGLKARDPFRFKLVSGNGTKPVLCLYPAENNRDIREESSVGTDANTLSIVPSSRDESGEAEKSEEKNIEDKGKHIITVKEENEEESIEHKSRLSECLNIEKWMHCSRQEASSSQSQSRFMSLTITPYSLKSNKLRLPVNFTRMNGINKAGTITLVGQDEVNHMVRLVKDSNKGRMRLGPGWKGFCEVHDVKIGDSFVLELLSDKDTNPVFKFCTKVNRI